MNCPGILPSAQQQGDSAPPREPHGEDACVDPPRPRLWRCSAFRLRLLLYAAGVDLWSRSPHRRAHGRLTTPSMPRTLALPHYAGRRPPNRRTATGCSGFGGFGRKWVRSLCSGAVSKWSGEETEVGREKELEGPTTASAPNGSRPDATTRCHLAHASMERAVGTDRCARLQDDDRTARESVCWLEQTSTRPLFRI